MIPVPLFRRWHWQPPANQEMRAVCCRGQSPLRWMRAGCSWSSGEGLRLLDPRTGSPRWFSEMGAPVVWAAYSADKMIVASPREIAALDLAQGTRCVALRRGRGGQGPGAARSVRQSQGGREEPTTPRQAPATNCTICKW